MGTWLLRLVATCGVLMLLFGVDCLALTQAVSMHPWGGGVPLTAAEKLEWVLALVCIPGGFLIWRWAVRKLRELANEKKQAR